ncbi:MAG TPA: hypothetical protein VGR41_08690 [Actinomycetota bacterium]|jgi:hypothetical protein|nr:hypothetical protein [Actinomycetota bacterium]
MPAGAEICEICVADLGERSMAPTAADLPPAAAETDLRFSDVIAELEAFAQLASEREEMATTALRAGSPLARLRAQFMSELGLPSADAGTISSPL